ncbi:gliding motility lipoprotein GldJ [Tenacibaculum maritimum]|uniref:Gliding motility lipoprotein GldJ n=1 Tax=Tenacibaculum maritimum NCIMB 2154 TaxID=1349785 RepID=A0A2H1E7X7_9FLAO|nr:gliding motility lipoprotein GldJ [Tenacibaculum maritimum]MCD9562918.1 gliding motility lipoprotein GldJ [Tenacibaculum maritimum]MCD9566377.1 gliding motility lipoprotein GldJ [Tenacibaculum maritimum]MCD9579721.1 gliding motility lipoprotein GldJ [Tenacibaculum maritimum]MCD9585147.1 gliding motility lipoprotein GldJ [Tenacibaculum maritimum]MCD9597834.1 gliding motility lipoprotein GldJ [Tenacibaculum maritimum]
MKSTLRLFSLLAITSLLITGCNSSRGNSSQSSLTGWNFNDPNYGGYLKGKFKEGRNPPPGMVHIEGGTFTMGLVQDDVMFDWNTTPKKMHVRSFYMDETEVTNAEYGLFMQYTRDVFPPEEEQYERIYESTLPDTLVWRKGLGNTNLLAESYLRHPAYADYPVVGVSWIQANKYCKWRTNAVNLKILMDKGVIKNIFKEDSIAFKGKNNFDTDTYLTDPYALFDGDSTIYKRGLPVPRVKRRAKPAKGAFTGRQVTSSDGILEQKFRLPTEVEWEYAAKAIFENREYNNVRGRKKYAWNGKYTRDRNKVRRGDQLANFKQGKGDYSGIAGWSSDGSDIPTKVKSYPPNAFGLYDMSGNVAEWVADVYRPIIDSEANDFNYFRGNIFTKKLIGEDGKVVIIGDGEVEYDTLVNGRIVPKDLPGSVKYIPITKTDTYMRRNYKVADNSNLRDGDYASSKYYNLDKEELEGRSGPRMYNSPKKPEQERDSLGNVVENFKYDAKRRTTLISEKTRVYKGGSWADREYWLDPAQRRYFPQYMATNYIGFRCATDKVGPMMMNKKKTPMPKYRYN